MIDHLRNTQSVGLEDLAVLVLDEADRLLEMGFAEEVRGRWAQGAGGGLCVCVSLSVCKGSLLGGSVQGRQWIFWGSSHSATARSPPGPSVSPFYPLSHLAVPLPPPPHTLAHRSARW